ncbi:ankyrin, partial [Backusella circina FSU 941]
IGLVKFALDHGASINSVVNGYMPLQLACINDSNIAVVQYLIDRGADINAQRWSKKHSTDKSQAVAGAIGSTALHVACVNGCTRNVDLLLRNGARANVKDKYGSRPIDLAAAKHHVEIVKLLRAYGSSEHRGGIQQETGTKLRRSIDISYSTSESSKEHLRRPSLPCIVESRNSQTNIPPVPSLPPPRNRSCKSSDGSDILGSPPTYPCENDPDIRQDYYSYGVMDHFDDENYLISLERRAFGHSHIHEDVSRLSTESAISSYRPSSESASLQRYSSDGGGYLRATALMNAMYTNSTDDNEPLPRPSIYIDRPDADTFIKQDKESKKTWWNSIMGGNAYKSYSDHPRHSLESHSQHRSSVDHRRSIDSLSHLAKRSIEGLSCKNTEFSDSREGELKKTNGFISRWVGNWSTKR